MIRTDGQEIVMAGNMLEIIWQLTVMSLFLWMLFIGVNAVVKRELTVVNMPMLRVIL